MILASTAAAEFCVIRVCDHDLEKQVSALLPQNPAENPREEPPSSAVTHTSIDSHI